MEDLLHVQRPPAYGEGVLGGIHWGSVPAATVLAASAAVAPVPTMPAAVSSGVVGNSGINARRRGRGRRRGSRQEGPGNIRQSQWQQAVTAGGSAAGLPTAGRPRHAAAAAAATAASPRWTGTTMAADGGGKTHPRPFPSLHSVGSRRRRRHRQRRIRQGARPRHRNGP